MKILTAAQTQLADRQTIVQEPVAGIDLMERAARACYNWFHAHVSRSQTICVFCGPGNNGADGLALSRMLLLAGYKVSIFLVESKSKPTHEFDINLERLKALKVSPELLFSNEDFSKIQSPDVVVDALLGTGLTKKPSGLFGDLVTFLNQKSAQKIAIDIPTGLFAEPTEKVALAFQADITLTFQQPKLAFMLPNSGSFAGQIEVLPIGILPEILAEIETNYFYTTQNEISKFLKPRPKFSHKGKFGHALLIAGSKGKMGAAVLAAKAALRTGCGLLTAHVPNIGLQTMQASVPEAMVQADDERDCISFINQTEKATAIGIGPGLGMHAFTSRALLYFFVENQKPLVVDADALNLLSVYKYWAQLPEKTILTPHLGEFERMVGAWETDAEMLKKAQTFAKTFGHVLVLKGAHTAVCLPDGTVHFNSTGTAAMAKGGSGDVLTGIILSLLAQGFTPEHAAIVGVYVHGKAGESAALKKGEWSVLAGDIIEEIELPLK